MSEPLPNPIPGRRDTRRKRQIRSALEGIYFGKPVLLDELRWAVRLEEANEHDEKSCIMTRSWLNSFARSIREQLPGYRIQKIGLDDRTPLSIVARAAVFRLKQSRQLRRFLRGGNPCILCRWVTNIAPGEPRYRAGHATPQHHAAMFRLFHDIPKRPTDSMIQRIPGVFIPGTHRLSILAPRDAVIDLRAFAQNPWKLFGYYEINEWYEVDATAELGQVKRNVDRYGRI